MGDKLSSVKVNGQKGGGRPSRDKKCGATAEGKHVIEDHRDEKNGWNEPLVLSHLKKKLEKASTASSSVPGHQNLLLKRGN